MMLTERAIVDPTDLIKSLLTGAMSNIKFGTQEDIHGNTIPSYLVNDIMLEINLLILDTLEEAFNVNQEGNEFKLYYFKRLILF